MWTTDHQDGEGVGVAVRVCLSLHDDLICDILHINNTVIMNTIYNNCKYHDHS